MNKTLAVILGIIILALIGGAVYYASQNPGTMATSTPATVTQTTTNTPVVQTPGIPTAVTHSSVSATDNTAIVNGTVTPNGAFTSYWYEYGSTINLGNKTTAQTVGSGFVSIQAPGYIVGLAANATYYFRLAAQNQYGTMDGQTYSFQTTQGTPAPVGSAPRATTVAANGISRTTANLNGQVNPNQAGTEYWFEYGKTTSLGNTSAFSSIGSGNTAVPASISLSDLDPLTTYYFRINAQNQFGTVNGAILNFKTTGPVSPSAPAATTGGATSVNTDSATLNGSVTPNGADTSYWFEYSTDSLLGSVLLNTTSPVSVGSDLTKSNVSTDISGLNGKTTYFYDIVAQNSLGTTHGSKQSFRTK